MDVKRDNLLFLLKNKISQDDYNELTIWTKNYNKRLLFFNSKFNYDLLCGVYIIQYISTGAYLGDGYIDTVIYKKIF